MDVVLTSVLRMAGGRMVLTVYTVQHCSAPQSVAGSLPAMWHTPPPLYITTRDMSDWEHLLSK